jgi:phage gp46-like protein
VQQRILLRLQMMRGWIYDDRGDLGSRLFESMSNTVDANYDAIPPLVLEALEPMVDEIVVDDIFVTADPQDSKSLQVVIEYHLIVGGTLPQAASTVTFPLT